MGNCDGGYGSWLANAGVSDIGGCTCCWREKEWC